MGIYGIFMEFEDRQFMTLGCKAKQFKGKHMIASSQKGSRVKCEWNDFMGIYGNFMEFKTDNL